MQIRYIVYISIFLSNTLIIVAAEKNNTPPNTYNPVPVQYYIDSSSIGKFESQAYSGDTTAASALIAHYALVDYNPELEHYWMTIGLFHGSTAALRSYWAAIDKAPTVHVRDTRIRLVSWAWQQYSKTWSTELKNEVRVNYSKYNLYLP